MKTGIELIIEERKEQVQKHHRSISEDVILNDKKQLSTAARRLLYPDTTCSETPYNWNKESWTKIRNKTYKERLIIAGALIAAEIDRLNN